MDVMKICASKMTGPKVVKMEHENIKKGHALSAIKIN